jgi:hypothetical protein
MGIQLFRGYDRSCKRQTGKKLLAGIEEKNNFSENIGFIPEK